MQDEDRALLDGQPPERAVERVAIGDREQARRDPPARRPAAPERWPPMTCDAWPRRSTHGRAACRTQASKRSGSRRVGSSRQAVIRAPCRASSARSVSRRIRVAIAYIRSLVWLTSTPNASRSPRIASSTTSRTGPQPPCRGDHRRGCPLWVGRTASNVQGLASDPSVRSRSATIRARGGARGVHRRRHEAPRRPPVRGGRGRAGGHRADRAARPADAVGGVQPGPAAGRRHGSRAAQGARPHLRRGRLRRTSTWARGSASAPRSSSRASARRSTTAATRSRTRSTRTATRSTGRSRSGGSTSARRCRTSCSRPSTRAWAPGSRAATSTRSAAFLGIPDEFTPIGVMPVGRPLPDVRSPSLKRGWVPFEQFARWDRWE